MRRVTLAGFGFLAAFPCSVVLAGETMTGRPSVLDGDTLRLRGTVVGLHGIAAPGLSQTCESGTGQSVECGLIAARALAEHIGEASIACEPRGIDRHRRTVAVCHLGGEDLGAWMVANGLAVADRFAATDYVAHGTKAWAKRRGLWAGVFEDPSERKREDYSAKVQISALAK